MLIHVLFSLFLFLATLAKPSFTLVMVITAGSIMRVCGIYPICMARILYTVVPSCADVDDSADASVMANTEEEKILFA